MLLKLFIRFCNYKSRLKLTVSFYKGNEIPSWENAEWIIGSSNLDDYFSYFTNTNSLLKLVFSSPIRVLLLLSLLLSTIYSSDCDQKLLLILNIIKVFRCLMERLKWIFWKMIPFRISLKSDYYEEICRTNQEGTEFRKKSQIRPL